VIARMVRDLVWNPVAQIWNSGQGWFDIYSDRCKDCCVPAWSFDTGIVSENNWSEINVWPHGSL